MTAKEKTIDKSLFEKCINKSVLIEEMIKYVITKSKQYVNNPEDLREWDKFERDLYIDTLEKHLERLLGKPKEEQVKDEWKLKQQEK